MVVNERKKFSRFFWEQEISRSNRVTRTKKIKEFAIWGKFLNYLLHFYFPSLIHFCRFGQCFNKRPGCSFLLLTLKSLIHPLRDGKPGKRPYPTCWKGIILPIFSCDVAGGSGSGACGIVSSRKPPILSAAPCCISWVTWV